MNTFGKKGEDLAAVWLRQKGYSILHRNWRHRHYELDIIAAKENSLHFIEVKSRNSTTFGYPEESISLNKFRNLQRAAAAFLVQFPSHKRIQYDVLSILRNRHPGSKEPYAFLLIEDVYF